MRDKKIVDFSSTRSPKPPVTFHRITFNRRSIN